MQLKNFVGQQPIKKDLYIHLANSIMNWVPLEHTVFYGLPGLGKTTIANLVAEEMGATIHQKTGKELNKDGLHTILKSIGFRDILFVDEIHSAPLSVMEVLYGPMQIINDLKINKDPMDKAFTFEGISIEPFTLIGATTSAGMISKPLRDRMILNYHFLPYTTKELTDILIMKNCPKDSSKFISERSRGVPRVALNYFLRIRNECFTEEKITVKVCSKVFERLGVDSKGFMATDVLILQFLEDVGNASESEIYKTLGVDSTDYRNMYEPFLMNKRFIRISSKGRSLTKLGKQYIKALK